ncbi:hypothetical protein [Acidovorax delafieldii]|uniref:hypothetical protein n=1 Tax=Acidovorax delafieldii TaxID=47920 RepID=UPI003ECD4227
MGLVISLHSKQSSIGLLDNYRMVMADGYNTGSTFNRGSVQVMIGFISAAVVALRVTGDEQWAKRFEGAGEELKQNWMAYPRVIPELCAEIDSS